MSRRARFLLPVLVLLCGFFGTVVLAETSKPARDDYYDLYKILVDTIDQVERNYVKKVDRRELIEAAIEGVLGKLDPYSTYISPEEYERFHNSVESSFGGIGIQVEARAGKLMIISPLVGTPAYKAGLMAGDHIVKIEGESTKGIDLTGAVQKMKGKPGTTVTITVVHPGADKEVEATITRQNIHVQTVLGERRKKDDTWDFMLNHDRHIGYLRVTAFSHNTADEIRAALEQLTSDDLRGLILDLRFNPGGLLRSAIDVCDLFISKGRIVSTSGRNSDPRTWEASKKNTFEDFPMVVLVNRYSASASEIVSACLQDHDRAAIMGERTWGKGSVQNVIELEVDPVDKKARSALKLTTAAYRRPNGKNIHRFSESKEEDEWGVVPDDGFRLKLSHEEMLAFRLDRGRRDVILPKSARAEPDKPEPDKPVKQPDAEPDEDGREGENEPPEKPEKPAFVDRHLQMAVDYLTDELAKAD